MTKSQIDKLGERLKSGTPSNDDLRLLDEYRQSFTSAYDLVVQNVIERTGAKLTGRRIKSTPSIIAKLKRQSVKLSQIQDIAGCRIIANSSPEQTEIVDLIKSSFEKVRLADRRQKPSHGYRAVHIIAAVNDQPVEIQVRTGLQHLWAQLSEQLADAIDPAIKYGGGPELQHMLLSKTSDLVAHVDLMEELIHQWEKEGKKVADKRNELIELRDQAEETFFQLIGQSNSKGMP